jgi:alkanesulfonate monooxygenase SsuD/methylene tetrahydromethanopterin reductase-like flavin-dependent oxidoreductase (luciferase family)
MELGIYSFAETSLDAATAAPGSAGERLRDLVEEIELADQVGLDVFGVGEHHRPDDAVSSPRWCWAPRTSSLRPAPRS